jgi:hypothetical protein
MIMLNALFTTRRMMIVGCVLCYMYVIYLVSPPFVGRLWCRVDYMDRKFSIWEEGYFRHIDDAAAEPQRVRALDLSNSGLRTLPGVVMRMTNVHTLWLNGNAISNLPSEISDLGQLQSLNLDNNNLAQLPPSLLLLTNLVALYMNGNRLQAIPSGITNLTKLRTLSVADNNIAQVNCDFRTMPQLGVCLRGNRGCWLDKHGIWRGRPPRTQMSVRMDAEAGLLRDPAGDPRAIQGGR